MIGFVQMAQNNTVLGSSREGDGVDEYVVRMKRINSQKKNHPGRLDTESDQAFVTSTTSVATLACHC